jgi:hypothetical protein
MRGTIGFGLVAAGILVGVNGLARWFVEDAPAVAMLEIPSPPLATAHLDRAAAAARVAPQDRASPPVSAAADERAAVHATPPRSVVAAALPADRQALARELQRALRRARCYAGPIHGRWTAASQRAMQAFTERANATLPVDKPDIVLLSLVRNEQGTACGPCPGGQQRAGGTCLPVAILEQAARKPRGGVGAGAAGQPSGTLPGRARNPDASATRLAARRTSPAALKSPPPITGRMSIGGPKRAAVDARRGPAGTEFAVAPATGDANVAMRTRARRAVYHRGRRFAAARAHRLRPMRLAYRPMRRYRGLAGLLFGGWPF